MGVSSWGRSDYRHPLAAGPLAACTSNRVVLSQEGYALRWS
jgi:hypothetical protein